MNNKLAKFKATIKIIANSECLQEIKNTAVEPDVSTPTLDEYNRLFDSLSKEESMQVIDNLDTATNLKIDKEFLSTNLYIDNLSDECIKGLVLFGQLELLEYNFTINYNVFNKTVYTFEFKNVLNLPIKDYTFKGEFNMSKMLYNKLINSFIANNVCFEYNTKDMSEKDKYLKVKEEFEENINNLIKSGNLDTSDIKFDTQHIPEGITEETMDQLNDFIEDITEIIEKQLRHRREQEDNEEDYE